MENNKNKNKKPLKLSSSGRLQIRKNLGPSKTVNKNQGSKKTIQIPQFRYKATELSVCCVYSIINTGMSIRTEIITGISKNFSALK